MNGTISYASQNVWLFPGTIRHNVVFGNEYDKQRYEQVLRCCALVQDIESLKSGDSTLIGQTNAAIGKKNGDFSGMPGLNESRGVFLTGGSPSGPHRTLWV